MHLYLLLRIPAKLAEKSKILTKNTFFGPIYIYKVKSPELVRQLPRKFFGNFEKNEYTMHLYLLLTIPAKFAEKSKILTKNHLFWPQTGYFKVKICEK